MICFPRDQVIPSPCKSITTTKFSLHMFSYYCLALQTIFSLNPPLFLVNPVIKISTDYVHYSQEVAILRRDILAIVEEETASIETADRNHILQRVREAFNSNAQRSRTDLSPPTVPPLPTPSSSSASLPSVPPQLASLPQLRLSSSLNDFEGIQNENYEFEAQSSGSMDRLLSQNLETENYNLDPSFNFELEDINADYEF